MLVTLTLSKASSFLMGNLNLSVAASPQQHCLYFNLSEGSIHAYVDSFTFILTDLPFIKKLYVGFSEVFTMWAFRLLRFLPWCLISLCLIRQKYPSFRMHRASSVPPEHTHDTTLSRSALWVRHDRCDAWYHSCVAWHKLKRITKGALCTSASSVKYKWYMEFKYGLNLNYISFFKLQHQAELEMCVQYKTASERWWLLWRKKRLYTCGHSSDIYYTFNMKNRQQLVYNRSIKVKVSQTQCAKEVKFTNVVDLCTVNQVTTHKNMQMAWSFLGVLTRLIRLWSVALKHPLITVHEVWGDIIFMTGRWALYL